MARDSNRLENNRSWAGRNRSSSDSSAAGDGSQLPKSSKGKRLLLFSVIAIPILFFTMIIAAIGHGAVGSNALLYLTLLCAMSVVVLRFLLPIGIYLDVGYLKKKHGNGPFLWPYLFSSIMAPPPAEIMTIVFYLYRRRRF